MRRNKHWILTALALSCLVAVNTWAASPEDVIKEAQQAERDNKTAQAAVAYESFLTRYADHSQVVEVHFRLAKLYDILGKIEDMEKHLQAVVASDKKQFRNRAEAFIMLAKHYAMLKKHEDAVKLLETLLGEGVAGLFEEEALNLCATYYVTLKRYDDAAAKFNLLKLRRDSAYAESAAYKIPIIWLNAGKLDLAIAAISDFANAYPNNADIPDLLLRAADAYREIKKYDTAASLCEQIQARYPKSVEAQASLVMIGLCYRDQKKFKEAVEIFDKVAKVRELQGRGIAGEALAQSAELYFNELNNPDAAMTRYEEAAKLVRDSESENKSKLLELCYFRLAEFHFTKKSWAAAREYYLQLRNAGSQLNVTPRILQCDEELKSGTAATGPQIIGDNDVKMFEEEIKKNPGTFRAAELEIFLLDRKTFDGLKRRASVVELAPQYENLLKGYPAEVLGQDNLETYIWWQIGSCYESGPATNQWQQAVTAFEKVRSLDADNKNGFKLNALERLALNAERVGDKPRAVQAYKELYTITKAKIDPKNPNADQTFEKRAMDYLKSLITRADTPDMVEDAIALTKQAIEERGPLSDTAREARLYLAELYSLKRDFASAAQAFQEYINVYGPRQGDDGNFLDGPMPGKWPPDEKTAQLHEAAIRLAHCWYVQRHEQNLLKVYNWIAKNLPNGNKYMAEVNYALALELSKGKDATSKENKRKYAETLWKTVVSTSTDFEDGKWNATVHFWVRPGDETFAALQPYVRNAILRAGQAYSEAGDHELAAGAFNKFMVLYGQAPGKVGAVKKNKKNVSITVVDTEVEMARYALGLEYIALGKVDKLAETYKPYASGLRDSKYRLSALMQLGFHASKGGMKEPAIEAYATILDEYGENAVNEKDEIIPVPVADRIRQKHHYNWDGIRIDPPASLDLGNVRFSLGYLYWKIKDWAQCARALAPFLTDPALGKTKSADRALYMLGQSYYKNYDYTNGYKAMAVLIEKYPKFEAIEEVYVTAATGAVETQQWKEVDRLVREFTAKWPKSDRKARMELYTALQALFDQGASGPAISQIKGLAQGQTYEDVKADAWYWLGRHELAVKQPNHAIALDCFEKSVSAYARDAACLEAARCAVRLRQWEKAKLHLDRVLSEFAKGNPSVVHEARTMMPSVLKEIAKPK